jgi:hypothetical protein
VRQGAFSTGSSFESTEQVLTAGDGVPESNMKASSGMLIARFKKNYGDFMNTFLGPASALAVLLCSPHASAAGKITTIVEAWKGKSTCPPSLPNKSAS